MGDTKAEQTFRSHAAASFHTLAAAGSATGRNNGQFRTPIVGGKAYWFDQITISSPGVPTGTIGTANFTLFFEGKISTGPLVATQPTPYYAQLQYGLEGDSDQADGRPWTTSVAKSRRIEVFSGYTDIRSTQFTW